VKGSCVYCGNVEWDEVGVIEDFFIRHTESESHRGMVRLADEIDAQLFHPRPTE
jgi:hypothetical protein